ncbi:hypothetical protein NKH77_33450 [Streptomyces sp. M19]
MLVHAQAHPKEFKEIWEPRLEISEPKWAEEMRDKWVNGHPIKNWNLDNADKGKWWVPQINSDPNAQGDVDKCWEDSSFWANTREKPDEPEAIDTRSSRPSRTPNSACRTPTSPSTPTPTASRPSTCPPGPGSTRAPSSRCP